jgi:hypothetical protein
MCVRPLSAVAEKEVLPGEFLNALQRFGPDSFVIYA